MKSTITKYVFIAAAVLLVAICIYYFGGRNADIETAVASNPDPYEVEKPLELSPIDIKLPNAVFIG
ncbi:MAG: hypothetical protein JSU70_19175, partial [Phycisphaerales bacterium]